jgi:hypothetical protein
MVKYKQLYALDIIFTEPDTQSSLWPWLT